MNGRRSFLKHAALLAAASSMPALASAAQAAPGERILRLYNTHTGESLLRVFWAEGLFISDALQDINQILRDHRNDQVAEIDPQLMLLVNQVSRQFGDNHVLHVISGYRSPASNAKLHAQSSGVARHSLHMDGKAIDIRIPGKSLAQLRKAAMELRGGGVGYYPDAQFVHMDTGRVRYW